jgi:hypothetical protein
MFGDIVFINQVISIKKEVGLSLSVKRLGAKSADHLGVAVVDKGGAVAGESRLNLNHACSYECFNIDSLVSNMLRYFLLLLISLFMLFNLGCANRQIVSSEPVAQFANPSSLIRSAKDHEKKGDLHKALMEYRIVHTLKPGNSKAIRAIERLESLIAEKTDKLMAIAAKKYRKGKLQSAEALYLNILSLDPKHRVAFSKLREINKKKLQKRMQQKVALSQRYRKSSNRKKGRNSDDEGYIYSRQAILQTETRAKDVASHIAELEKHIAKYPNDTELRVILYKVRVVQARAAFNESEYENSLQHLAAAERLVSSEKKLLKDLSDIRKEFGKELYLRGVRRVRSEPINAVELWRLALKFDPHDKRTQLRIDTYKNQY